MLRKILSVIMLLCAACSVNGQSEYSKEDIRYLNEKFGEQNIIFSRVAPSCLTISYPTETIGFDSAHAFELKGDHLFLFSAGGSTIVFDVIAKKELIRKPVKIFQVSAYGGDLMYTYSPAENVTAVASLSEGILYKGGDNVNLFNRYYIRSTFRRLPDGNGKFLSVAFDASGNDSLDLPRGSVTVFGGLLFINSNRPNTHRCYTADLKEIFSAEETYERHLKKTKIQEYVLVSLEARDYFTLNTANIPVFTQPFAPLTKQESVDIRNTFRNMYTILLDKQGKIVLEWPGDVRINNELSGRDVLTVYNSAHQKLYLELAGDGSYKVLSNEEMEALRSR